MGKGDSHFGEKCLETMASQPQLVLVASIDDEPIEEQISPELVLVDPVLAERARALHEPPAPWVPLRVAPAPVRPPEVVAPPSPPVAAPLVVDEPALPSPQPEPELAPAARHAAETPPAEPEREAPSPEPEPEPELAPFARHVPEAPAWPDTLRVERAAPPLADPLEPEPPQEEGPEALALEPAPADEPPMIPRAVPRSVDVAPLRPVIVPAVPATHGPASPRPALPETPETPALPATPAREEAAEAVRPAPPAPAHASVPVPAAPVRTPAPRTRQRRVGHSAGLLATGIVVGLVGGVLAADTWMPARSPVVTLAPSAAPDGAPSPAAGSAAPVAAAPSVSGPKARSTKRPTTPAATSGGAKAKGARTQGTKKTAKKTQPAPAAVAPVPAFVWAAVPGATRYEVVFERGGKVVYGATTRATRLELPRAWRYDGKAYRLEPGRYHWTVWPIVGGSRGKPVVSSDYTV